MCFPDRPVEGGINGIDIVGTPSHEQHLLEAEIRNEVAQDDRRCQGGKASRLIVDLGLVEQLQALHLVLYNFFLASRPAVPLRVSALARPIGAPKRGHESRK